MSLTAGRQTSFLLKYLDVDKPRVGINSSIGTTSSPPCSKSCNTLNDHNGRRKLRALKRCEVRRLPRRMNSCRQNHEEFIYELHLRERLKIGMMRCYLKKQNVELFVCRYSSNHNSDVLLVLVAVFRSPHSTLLGKQFESSATPASPTFSPRINHEGPHQRRGGRPLQVSCLPRATLFSSQLVPV